MDRDLINGIADHVMTAVIWMILVAVLVGFAVGAAGGFIAGKFITQPAAPAAGQEE